VGDEAVALFIPGFAGEDHAARAVPAARDLIRAAGHFTALGDTVNIAARLRSEAGPGQILVSDAAASAAGLDVSGLEHRDLELRGRDQRIGAWVESASSLAPAIA
jgi:adenylate cyclase